MKEKQYRVTWEIDVYAKSPKEAAKQAFIHMQVPTSATCFDVKEEPYSENPPKQIYLGFLETIPLTNSPNSD